MTAYQSARIFVYNDLDLNQRVSGLRTRSRLMSGSSPDASGPTPEDAD